MQHWMTCYGLLNIVYKSVNEFFRFRSYAGVADRATRLGGSPHLSCKCDQTKTGDYIALYGQAGYPT